MSRRPHPLVRARERAGLWLIGFGVALYTRDPLLRAFAVQVIGRMLGEGLPERVWLALQAEVSGRAP